MQQFNSVTLEAARVMLTTPTLATMAWQTSSDGEFVDGYRVIASYGTAFKAPTMSQITALRSNRTLNRRRVNSGKGFEGLTGPVNWRITGYHVILIT